MVLKCLDGLQLLAGIASYHFIIISQYRCTFQNGYSSDTSEQDFLMGMDADDEDHVINNNLPEDVHNFLRTV